MGRVERSSSPDQPPASIQDEEEVAQREPDADGENFKNFLTRDRVGVSFGVTLNTGNYSSVKMDIWQASDVPPDMSPAEVRDMLMQQLQHEVREFSRPIKAKKERK